MDEGYIVSKVNGFLHSATKELIAWLEKMLPRVSKEWWQECVLDNLSYEQRSRVTAAGYSKLEQLDLAALLRITDKSWYDMRSFAYLPTSDRECVRALRKVRNNWAHISGALPEKDVIIDDLQKILNFLESVMMTNVYTNEINAFIAEIQNADFSAVYEEEPVAGTDTASGQQAETVGDDNTIKEKDRVYLKGTPNIKGMVFSISEVGGLKKYEVFVDGEIKTFFEGQIVRIDDAPSYQWVDLATLQSNLTAYEINNPSIGNLYSLNAARIDFVPYQFRPALKLIKSDEPRILIADSVGVGKTIEAGLIIKELEARNELSNILIICPKPLVAERKWELEMQRFDEEFIPLDGASLRQVLSDNHRDGEWPSRYNKAIIPYSILDSRTYQGTEAHKGKTYGLLDLDPAPHFDLVIIDEAHHIRNGSLEKEKAFAYKCVRYFCEHADAVVMLTATPLQTKDDDLYTLLNLLRPDVVMDKKVFDMMSKPNEFIYRASHIVRGAAEGWQDSALAELQSISTTHWGENVIAKNPLYADVITRLQKQVSSREERVKLVSDIESLHSFNTMLNRTRRKDIQDFCIRRTYTVETQFTPEQNELYDALLQFEYNALARLHNTKSITFLMSTIRRQAASCIFGLAPYIRDIVARRLNCLIDDPDFDMDEYDLDAKSGDAILSLAHRVLQLADNLPDYDPKFISIANILEEKQKYENNKVIIFSTFRHTLAYLSSKFESMGYRFAQINGSVHDENRRLLRERFELPKSDPNAIDILLFTEVGSEGLDYQFCDTMINYDLPWNPMRIEQRIGRIDRRGQKSEVINIYNIITAGTVDADIYSRCLMRIGIFEKSIGECEEVLGEIGSQIEKIAMNPSLTTEERRQKLEQMADNEVRTMQELSRLEDEEHALFGFDLSSYTMSKEIRNAESPWISPRNIQLLVERYLAARNGERQYIVGNSDIRQLRLDKSARMLLLEDFRQLSNVKSAVKRKWEAYLKGTEPYHPITFVSEAAAKERNAFFITPTHPLVKQAAQFFATSEMVYIHLTYDTDELPKGTWAFSVYAWSYVGLNPRFKVVPICENNEVEAELTEILQEAVASPVQSKVDKDTWCKLEDRHIGLWQAERDRYAQSAQTTATYKLESIGANFRSRKRGLEQKIEDAFDEKIRRMYQGELTNATEVYQRKVVEIKESASRADIHTTLIANGIVEIKGV